MWEMSEVVEIINGVPVDWSKYGGSKMIISKKSYIELCELLHKNGHKLLSKYKNARTKILIDFKCGHKPHEMLSNNYRQGNGCPKCVNYCSKQAKEDFVNIVNNNGHTLLSEYTNNRTKVLIDFNCGHESHWIRPADYKSGKGCPKCAGLCPEQAKEDLIELINENGHKLLSEYVNNSTKVLIDFNCGHESHWIKPNHYKRGVGCPKCAGKCPEQAKEDFMSLINKNRHKLLSEYVDASTKVLIDYNCGHEPHWITPNSYKKGVRCPKCSGNCPEQAKEDFMNMINKNNHSLLSEYVDTQTKVLINFNCGHEAHWIKPNSYKNGVRCPKCKNKGEMALYDLLLDMGHEVHTQKKYENLKDKTLLSYDFYLPKYNLLIELDGDHHREPIPYYTKDMTDIEKDMADIDAEIRFYDRKHKDRLKDDYAKNNNIPLLRMEYFKGKIELDKWRELVLDKIGYIEIERMLMVI